MTNINLHKVKKLSNILQGKAPRLRKTSLQAKMKAMGLNSKIMAAMNPDDPLQRDVYVFHYKGSFHQIEGGRHKKIGEPEVKNLLIEAPEAECFYLCSSKLMCPLPQAFSGINAEAIVVKDDAAVVAFINSKSGSTITKKDL